MGMGRSAGGLPGANEWTAPRLPAQAGHGSAGVRTLRVVATTAASFFREPGPGLFFVTDINTPLSDFQTLFWNSYVSFFTTTIGT
jgi:hypothetical protein